MKMNHTTIHYLATKSELVKIFQQLYEPQGYVFEAFQPINGIPATLKVLLLIEPLKLDGYYFSFNRLWKHYLFKHHPDARLVVAAYAASSHANVFSLLSFPPELEAFLEKTVAVSEYPFAHSGTKEAFGEIRDKYIDTWTVSLPHTGRPAMTEMQHFLDGHDRHRSVSAQLFHMRAIVRNMLVSSDAIDPVELKELFKVLRQRWYYYKRLFAYLPFADVLDEINRKLEKVGTLLEAKPLEKTTLEEELAAIYRMMESDIHPIVFAETYW